jgi:hypothetical protein
VCIYPISGAMERLGTPSAGRRHTAAGAPGRVPAQSINQMAVTWTAFSLVRFLATRLCGYAPVRLRTLPMSKGSAVT